MEPQLPRVHASVVGNRGRLAPDQFRSTGAETDVAAKRQLVGQAVERSIAAFHRLNRPAVADPSATDLNRLKHHRQVVGHGDVREAKPLGIGDDIGGRLVSKIVSHESWSGLWCGSLIRITMAAEATGGNHATG